MKGINIGETSFPIILQTQQNGQNTVGMVLNDALRIQNLSEHIQKESLA